MTDIKEAPALIRKEYDRLDRICGVDTSAAEISISTRMSRKLGSFETQRSFLHTTMRIKISAAVLQSDELFTDVIRHEYAHMVVYLKQPRARHGHDAAWKAVCRQIGCRPRATTNLDDYPEMKQKSGSGTGKRSSSAKVSPYRYSIVCLTCGASSRYKTESKTVKIAEGKLSGFLVCRRCGGRTHRLDRI